MFSSKGAKVAAVLLATVAHGAVALAFLRTPEEPQIEGGGEALQARFGSFADMVAGTQVPVAPEGTTEPQDTTNTAERPSPETSDLAAPETADVPDTDRADVPESREAKEAETLEAESPESQNAQTAEATPAERTESQAAQTAEAQSVDRPAVDTSPAATPEAMVQTLAQTLKEAAPAPAPAELSAQNPARAPAATPPKAAETAAPSPVQTATETPRLTTLSAVAQPEDPAEPEPDPVRAVEPAAAPSRLALAAPPAPERLKPLAQPAPAAPAAPAPTPPAPQALSPVETAPVTITATDQAASGAPLDSPRPRPRPAAIAAKAPPPPDAAPAPRRTVRTEASAPRQRQGNSERDSRRGSAQGAETATARTQGQRPAAGQSGNARASDYPGQVMRKIQRVPRPRSSTRGSAIISFTIAASGGLVSAGVARSSGSTQLDRDALRVVRRAAPFPPPPAGARRSYQVQIKGR
ncbi:MAG: TonB family protein [Pseudomonadota bacterium]